LVELRVKLKFHSLVAGRQGSALVPEGKAQAYAACPQGVQHRKLKVRLLFPGVNIGGIKGAEGALSKRELNGSAQNALKLGFGRSG